MPSGHRSSWRRRWSRSRFTRIAVPLAIPVALGLVIGIVIAVQSGGHSNNLSQTALGAAVALTPVNLITLLIGTQVLQGIVTPVVLIYILILTNRRDVLGDAANKPVFRTVATVAIIGISGMSLLLLGQTALGWFGIG